MTVPLRMPRDDDHAELSAIRRDEALQHMLMASPGPGGDPDVAGWLARRAAAGAIWTIADADDHCAGFAQIMQIHRRNRFAWFGMCVAPAAQGAGLGRSALKALATEALGLSLRKLLCEVRADNAAALALYASEGFREVGALRGHYDDGEAWRDVVLMERMLAGPLA